MFMFLCSVVYMCVAREMLEDLDDPRIGGGGGGIDPLTARHQAWSAGGVMFLFVLAWLFGVLALRKSSAVLEWLFCVLNTLMVILMFLSRCIFYPHVRSNWVRLWGGDEGNGGGSISFSRGRRWPTTGRDSDSSSSLSQSFDRHQSDVFSRNSIITSGAASSHQSWYRNVIGDDLPTPPPIHRRHTSSPVSDTMKYGRSNVNFNNSESISACVEKQIQQQLEENEIEQVYDHIDPLPILGNGEKH